MDKNSNLQNTASAQPLPSYKAPKKVYNPLLKIDKIFAAIIFVLCFVIVDLAAFGEMKMGFTISYGLLLAVSGAYLYKKNNKFAPFGFICGALSLAGAVTFALFNNSLINAFMFILIMALYVIFVLDFSKTFKNNKGSFKIAFDGFNSVFIRPFGAFPVIAGSIKAGTKKDKKSIGTIVGILVSVPFLALIIPLLVKSDAAFEGLIKSIGKQLGVYLVEIVIATLVFPYAYSFLFSHRNRIAHQVTDTKNKKLGVLPYSACVSFLTMICITYVVYMFSQLAYFFSAFSNILPEGYTNTASEFARRGFYEMFAVCVINVLIITGVNMLLKKPKRFVALKLLSLFISLFSVLLIVVAMQKMRMNIGVYCLTANRILVFTFMAMMLVILAFFILHQFAPKMPYMQSIIVICSAMFIALSFSNVDAIVAKYNIESFQKGVVNTLDLEAIADLSDSGVPYLVKLAKEDSPVGNDAKEKLKSLIAYTYADEFKVTINSLKLEESKEFKKLNYAHTSALHEIYSYYGTLDEQGQKVFANRCYMEKNGYYDEEADEYINWDDESSKEKVYRLNKDTNLYEFYKTR